MNDMYNRLNGLNGNDGQGGKGANFSNLDENPIPQQGGGGQGGGAWSDHPGRGARAVWPVGGGVQPLARRG